MAVGAEGVAGTVVAVDEPADVAGLVPVVFAPVTETAYVVPPVNPVIVIGDAPVALKEPGVVVAVKVVTAPPVAAGV